MWLTAPESVCLMCSPTMPRRQHDRPAPPASLRIYEAHVGMSSEEPKVASYTEFRGTTISRQSKLPVLTTLQMSSSACHLIVMQACCCCELRRWATPRCS